MSINLVKKAIAANPTAAAKGFNKQEIYAVIEDIAESIKQPGESVEKARVRATKTPEGAAVMAAYAVAPRAPQPHNLVNTSAEDFRKSMNGGDVIAAVDIEARKLMVARPGLSLAAARKMAWEANGGALKARYDKHRAGSPNARPI